MNEATAKSVAIFTSPDRTVGMALGFDEVWTLSLTWLVFVQVSGAQLQSSVERPCPMDPVTFTCTLSSLAHQWMVPSRNISRSLSPADEQSGVPPDPPFQFAVTEVMAGSFTSTAVFTTTENLNGTLVLCRDGNLMIPDNQNRTINLRAPLVVPGTPSVSFPIPRKQFTITWDEPTLYMNETVDTYFVNISGPEDLCGNGNTLQMVTERNCTCTIETTPQEGEIYIITVAATSCDGRLRGPESEPVHLQVPDTPTFIEFQPDCPDLSFVDIVWQNTGMVMPAITEVCVNCTGDNCTYECRLVSGNNPFCINIVPGENYTISLSLRNGFGQSGESAPELYVNGEEQCPPTTSPTTSTPLTQPPSPTPTSSPPPTQLSPQASSDAGVIAGGVIGGIIGGIIIVLIVIVIAYLIWRKKNSLKPKWSEDIKLKAENADRNGHNPENMYQDPQSTEADTEGVYDLLERNKSTEELQEQGDPNTIAYGPVDTLEMKQNPSYGPVGQPHPTSSEAPQPAPVYDEVGTGGLELKENVAYGPVDTLEMKQNPSYGPVGHALVRN